MGLGNIFDKVSFGSLERKQRAEDKKRADREQRWLTKFFLKNGRARLKEFTEADLRVELKNDRWSMEVPANIVGGEHDRVFDQRELFNAIYEDVDVLAQGAKPTDAVVEHAAKVIKEKGAIKLVQGLAFGAAFALNPPVALLTLKTYFDFKGINIANNCFSLVSEFMKQDPIGRRYMLNQMTGHEAITRMSALVLFDESSEGLAEITPDHAVDMVVEGSEGIGVEEAGELNHRRSVRGKTVMTLFKGRKSHAAPAIPAA